MFFQYPLKNYPGVSHFYHPDPKLTNSSDGFTNLESSFYKNFQRIFVMITISTKGQIISKRSGHGFFQKTNENMSHTSKNEFIFLFFGRILGLTQLFALEINRPLANSKKKLFWTNRKCVFVFQWLKLKKICVKNHEVNW